jgi:hypothetical protein
MQHACGITVKLRETFRLREIFSFQRFLRKSHENFAEIRANTKIFAFSRKLKNKTFSFQPNSQSTGIFSVVCLFITTIKIFFYSKAHTETLALINQYIVPF